MPFFDPRRQADLEYQQVQQNQNQIREQMRAAGASDSQIQDAVKQYADQWRAGGGGVPAPVGGGAYGVAPGALPGAGGAVPGAPGAGAAESPFDKLLRIYEEGYTSAREANEARYAEARALQEGLGEQEAADIRQAYQGLGTAAAQDLVSRGLTGTTIGPSVQAGVQREETAALGRLGERIRGEQIGLIERREDLYPDLGMLLEIGQMAGAGQFGAQPTAAQQPGQTMIGGFDVGGLAGLAQSGASLHVGGGSTSNRPAGADPYEYGSQYQYGGRSGIPSPREEFFGRAGQRRRRARPRTPAPGRRGLEQYDYEQWGGYNL